jgi:hypothetical protein
MGRPPKYRDAAEKQAAPAPRARGDDVSLQLNQLKRCSPTRTPMPFL